MYCLLLSKKLCCYPFLTHVQETMCDIRRSTDYPAKTKHFNFTRDNFLISRKLKFLMSQKLRV